VIMLISVPEQATNANHPDHPPVQYQGDYQVLGPVAEYERL